MTIIGIIIGVAAVMLIISVTQGAKKRIEEQVANLGGKSLIIQSGKRAAEEGKYSIELTSLVDSGMELVLH